MKPPAALSLDLDNLWSYMKTHGDTGWEEFPSYLDLVVPRALRLLDAVDLRITFFVVGQDAALERNHAALRSIAAAGHEVGNHSFRHEPWLHLYSEDEVEREIALAGEAIEGATGIRPRGFRGPGFSLSAAVVRALVRAGYRYDATTFPTFIGPLARAYYFSKSKLGAQELVRRKALFGAFSDGLRPNGPYRWRTDSGELLELPVTVLPGLRIPIHVSYLLYLASVSPGLARAYFASARALCRATGTPPSLLLHPLDFVDASEVPQLAFFPAMAMPATRKLELVQTVLHGLGRSFEVRPLGEHAAVLDSPSLDPPLRVRACAGRAGRLP